MVGLSELIVGLAFGGGLVPGLLAANKAAIGALSKAEDPRRFASGTGGPTLACAPLLLYPAPLYVADVINVVSRCESLRTRSRGIRREEFEALLSSRPPRRLRVMDAPAGAAADAASPQRPLPKLATEAAWTALSGGSPYVSQQEAERQLARWLPPTSRGASSAVALREFERSLLQGRAVVASGYVVLFGLQALVLALFVVKPLAEAVG